MGVTADIPLRALYTALQSRFNSLSTRFESVVTVVDSQGLMLNIVDTVDDMLAATISYAFTLCVNYTGTDSIVSLWVRVPRDSFADNGTDIRASTVHGDVSYLRVYVRENIGDVTPAPEPEPVAGVDYIELEKPGGGYLRYSYAASAVSPTLEVGDGTSAYPFIEFLKPGGGYIRWTATDLNVIDVTAGDGTGDTFESIVFNRGGSTSDQLEVSYGDDNNIILEAL
jgi:hypothetical protein